MIIRKLPDLERTELKASIPSYSDHCIFIEKIKKPFDYPEHFTGLGIVAMLEGASLIHINGDTFHLDTDAFLVINRGSRLAIEAAKKQGTLVLLYFNSILSELVSHQVFRYERDLPIDDPYDFSLIEHIHFNNASLKAYLPLLIDLGGSCASFHALKADMLLRNLLDQIIAENYEAFKCAYNLSVIKESTRVTLYKRLSMAREWLEMNYYMPITVEQVAGVAMLNQYHFMRLFKKAFGITSHQYLTNVRLTEAKMLLQTTDLTISEICYQIGFNSLSSFSLLFKERLNVSPSEFRQQHN